VHITLLANRDLHSNYALNLLLPRLANDHSLTLFLSDTVGGEPNRQSDLRWLQFLEQTLCNDLLFPALDGAGITGELLTFSALETFLQRPWAGLNDPNSEAGLAALAASSPDLMISLRYGRILQPTAISLPPRGVLNLHSGRLPQYRGVMATFRAMLSGDTLLGTTLHWIDDASIDTGRVVNTHSEPLDPQRCYFSNVFSLYDTGCAAIIEAIHALSTDEDLESYQAAGAGDYFSFPNASECRAFLAAGNVWADLEHFATTLQRYYPPAKAAVPLDLPRIDLSEAGLLMLYRATLRP
jgi:methionyl-tRNA formyltransferase